MMMSLTRRDLLMGTAALAGAGGGVVGAALATAVAAEGPLAVGSDSQPQATPVLVESRVPSLAELEQWELAYKIHYRTQHRARNQALHDMGMEDAPAMRVDKVAGMLEAEEAAAFSLVDEAEHMAIAMARGAGFIDRRDGKPATANPYWDIEKVNALRPGDDEHSQNHRYMAWFAGWAQAGDQSHVYGPRGYTPPKPYGCPFCGAAEGELHTHVEAHGGGNYVMGTHVEGTIVRRLARPGAMFT
jgi:hypothetical protein